MISSEYGGAVLTLHDSATGRTEELALRSPGTVSLYVCGPTVYDVPHLGHGRSALVYDILRRYLQWTGLNVEHVSNVTDIDDKIIARAAEEGRPAAEVAREYEEAWWDASDSLGVLRPTHAPRATEYVARMVDLIARLVDSGHAYEAPGGVWFSPSSIDGYGLLAHQSLDSLRAGARVDVDEAKRSPVDFALWKLARDGEPSWPSPWGAGRPGWHTECVVMSLDILGDGFDLHAGGMDLQFPHHENERAQAVALGKTFAHRWMHHAFIEVGGEKMSKSTGNFTSLTDLLSRSDPRAYRLLVLRAHYRSPMEVTEDSIADATDALGRLDSLARRVDPAATLEGSASGLGPTGGVGGLDDASIEQFRRRMEADLDTPGATALVFDLIRRSNAASDAGRAGEAGVLGSTALHLAGAVGLPALSGVGEVPPDVAALVAERAAARTRRAWDEADALRDRIALTGWIVEDGPAGSQTVRRS